ncbi:hypothetical protein [Sulfurimonas sp.]
MQVLNSNSTVIQDLYLKKLTNDEVKEIKQAIVDNANKYTFTNFSKNDFSSPKLSVGEQIQKNTQDFQKFLYSNGIDGRSVKRISELNFSTPNYLDIKA